MFTENCIVTWMKRTDRAITFLHDKKLEECGVTSIQLLVLAPLFSKESITQKEIQQEMNITAASVTELVNTLVENGFVIRKVDPYDSRSKRIYLTEQGKLLEPYCKKILLDLEKKITEGFTDEEIALLLSWMKKLYRNINKH